MEQKNKFLIIALVIPFLSIIGIVLSVYIPPLYMHPQHSFVYSIGYGRHFDVVNGAIIEEKNEYYDKFPEESKTRLYIYDTANGTNREVSFEELQNVKIDPTSNSADGFVVIEGGRSYFPFFYRYDYSHPNYYLKNNFGSKRIELNNKDGDYFNFMGWIINNKYYYDDNKYIN